MKKTVILGTIWVSLLTLSSFASADFDCSTIDRDEIKTLMDKQKAGETLTDDETTLLENTNACRPTNSWSGMMDRGSRWMWQFSWSWMTEEQRTKMEEIKTILEKQKAGETLTDEEQTTLDEFNVNKPEKSWSWAREWKWFDKDSKWQRWDTSKVSSAYKTKIDTKIENMVSSVDTNEEKIAKLEAFATKIQTILETIKNSSTYTETQKSTYNNILSYFLESIDTEISSLDEWIDSLLDEVLSE